MAPLDVDYPAGETEAHTVVLQLLVDEHGRVIELTALEGASAFVAAAKRSAASRRFSPATREGEALNTTLNKEALSASCYAYGCTTHRIGPLFLPNIGAEIEH